MYTGIRVGGFCINKDQLFTSWEKCNHINGDYNFEPCDREVRINDKMPFYLIL